jgi:hypothetical protein
VIRETVAGASLVVVDGSMRLAEIFRLEAEVRAHGSRLVLQGRARTACPVGGSEATNRSRAPRRALLVPTLRSPVA